MINRAVIGGLVAFLLVFSALQPAAVSAADDKTDPLPAFHDYVLKVFPECADSKVTIERIQNPITKNFHVYLATRVAKDPTCNMTKRLLYSPATQQVIIGSLLPLPDDARPLEHRVVEVAAEFIKNEKLVATIGDTVLPDGLKPVTIVRQTEFGQFKYFGLVDESQKVLILGRRGNLKESPNRVFDENIVSKNASRRGGADAATQIIEVSDLQSPLCAHAYDVIDPLVKDYLSKVNYVRIDFPLFERHDSSLPAAMAAWAIQKIAPEKYWKFVEFAYANPGRISIPVLNQYLTENKIDSARFYNIYNSKIDRQCMLDLASRIFELGINSVPTYVVNGQVIAFGNEGLGVVRAIKKAVNKNTEALRTPENKI